MGIGVAEDLSYHTNGLSNGTVIKRKKGRKPKNLENINGNTNHCSTATKRKSREGLHSFHKTIKSFNFLFVIQIN